MQLGRPTGPSPPEAAGRVGGDRGRYAPFAGKVAGGIRKGAPFAPSVSVDVVFKGQGAGYFGRVAGLLDAGDRCLFFRRRPPIWKRFEATGTRLGKAACFVGIPDGR